MTEIPILTQDQVSAHVRRIHKSDKGASYLREIVQDKAAFCLECLVYRSAWNPSLIKVVLPSGAYMPTSAKNAQEALDEAHDWLYSVFGGDEALRMQCLAFDNERLAQKEEARP